MDIVFTVLILLLAVAVSGIVAGIMPIKLPLPLLQIALGAVLALPVFGLHIDFDPELFLLLFIPPLLFTDGWRIPKREFFRLAKPIFALALGLVLFTVAGVGFFIHWMIPVIPLPAAFALAAVLSPTDAVAISATIGKDRLPPAIQHLLEGEALMNDASGLVACKFAVAAVLSGTFSLWEASLSFVVIALGGIAVGLLLAWTFGIVRKKIVEWSGDEPGIQVVLLLLIPFTAYIFAEHAGFSGILSAVAAGMLMPYVEMGSAESAVTRIQRNSMLTMLEFVFNGMSFILLGLQLPGILDLAHADARAAGNVPVWYLFAYIGAITAALILLRFFWVWFNLHLRSFASLIFGRQAQQNSKPSPYNMRLIAITSLSGVRGAITMAAIMALPLHMPDGSPFPARDLMIFLATGVILYSLIGASLSLPFLVRGLNMDKAQQRRKRELRYARRRVAEAAIASIEKLQERMSKDLSEEDAELLHEVASSLLATYRHRMDPEDDSPQVQYMARRFRQFEREMRMSILHAERAEIRRLRSERRIDDNMYYQLMSQIDLAETWQQGLLTSNH